MDKQSQNNMPHQLFQSWRITNPAKDFVIQVFFILHKTLPFADANANTYSYR